MDRWITADLHLGHTNIITYSGRPFRDADEMDAVQARPVRSARSHRPKGYVPSGDGHDGVVPLELSAAVGRSDRLRLSGPERDVIVVPHDRQHLVVSGVRPSLCTAPAHISPEEEGHRS